MSNNTIFDDVFRTMLQKMPQMAISLINEVFGKDYPENIKLKQGRNEFYTKDGKVITDSHFQIEEKIYHLECQSTKDATMMFRMIEYDFSVALESVGRENETSRIYFPHSCVLYLRDTQGPRLTRTAFFAISISLHEVQKIHKRDNREKEYRDMVELIIRIADYILRDSQKVRKGFGKVMGGKVLELESDKLIKKGIELERENTEKERQRADAAEAEVKRLKLLLQEKQ